MAGRVAGEVARVDRNLDWYGRNSRRCHAIYKCLKFSQIVIAAFIPAISAVIIGGDDAPWAPVATGLLGMLIVIIEGVQTTFQPVEKWMVYRAAAEGLKREKSLYDEAAGPYDGLTEADRRKLFVVRTEDLMSQEHASWRETNRSSSTGPGANNGPSRREAGLGR